MSYLRRHWSEVRIIVRGDSGFCRQRLIRWCERHDVGYVIGIARNARLQARVLRWEAQLENAWLKTGQKQRSIREFRYAADSWNCKRRVITRLEFGAQGNTRALWSPTWSCLPANCMTVSTANAARQKIGSRKPSWTNLVPAPVATSSWRTGCGYCSLRWHIP
jgi:hypothetical protein